MHRVVLSFGLVFVLSNIASAVLIASGNGTGNTTAPANDPGFANVVSTWVRTGSAVYLGNGWMLTDNHVGAGATNVNGTVYSLVPGSAHQLVNPPGSTFIRQSDVLLYQINGRPNLPSLQIGAGVPQVGQPVVMIGNGRDRVPAESCWTVQNSVWSSVPWTQSYAYAGYAWANTNEVRWGTNTIDATGFVQGSGNTQNVTLSMSFSSTNATPYEAIGTAGDSGGGVFSYNTSTNGWELTGLMDSYTQFSGEPTNLSVFGNLTYAIQLSTYRNQIMSYLTPGDLNGDSHVDIQDLGQVLNNWMSTNTAGDANHDGIVDIRDLGCVLNDWSPTGSGGGADVVGVPEPETCALAIGAVASFVPFAWRRFSRRRSRAECGFRSKL